METFSLQWKTEARWEEGLLWRQQHYNKNTTHHKQTQQNYTSDDNLKTHWETYVKSVNHYRMKKEKQNKTKQNERKKRTYLNKNKKENRFRSSITFESFSPSLFLVALKVCFEKEFVFFSTTFSFFFFFWIKEGCLFLA